MGLGVEEIGFLVSLFFVEIEGGIFCKDMKVGIYNIRKCIEVIKSVFIDFCFRIVKVFIFLVFECINVNMKYML